MPLYPVVEATDEGFLDTNDGHRVFWEAAGNPAGKPAVILHGGPGSGSSPAMRRFFDPDAYRMVQFDQRGCGRSSPHASNPGTDLSTNTTAHLICDIERLREHLRVDEWMVAGASWGSTLALAYAESHPSRVSELLLVGVTTTRRSEIDWLYRGVAPLFPEEWERFRRGVPEAERDGNLIEAYARLLQSADPAVRERAVFDWHHWEAATLSAEPNGMWPERWADSRYRLARARIVTHYFRHGAWLQEGALLRDAHLLAGIPGVMVQGRLDVQAPLATAWELAKAWTDGELVVVPTAGHASSDHGMGEAVVAATARLARR